MAKFRRNDLVSAMYLTEDRAKRLGDLFEQDVPVGHWALGDGIQNSLKIVTDDWFRERFLPADSIAEVMLADPENAPNN